MIINPDRINVMVDVDGTLVRRSPFGDKFDISIKNPYDNKTYYYQIHHEHIELLRQYSGRGFYIKVWSANGSGHAESVVRALKLDDGTVDEIDTKPMKVMDDKKSLEYIVGAHVFIPKKDWSCDEF